MFYKKLSNKIIIDKYIIFMFTAITIITIHQLYSPHSPSFWLDTHIIRDFGTTIRLNMEAFTSSPLQNINEGIGFNFQVTSELFSVAHEFSSVYNVLSYHSSWILNSVLSWLIVIGQFNIVFAGVLISTFIYRSKNEAQSLSVNEILKKQLLTAFCFVIALTLVVSILGSVALSLTHSRLQISHAEEMYLIMNLYNTIEGLWKPDILYYIGAVFGTLIYLLSGILFGIFIGHLFKSSTMAVLFTFYISFYFSALMYNFPISTFYFLPRILGYFVMISGIITIPGESLTISLSLLLLYLALIMFATKKLMDLHFKKNVQQNNEA